MKKQLLILALILSITTLKGQNLFKTFKHDTVSFYTVPNEIIAKSDLYETAKTFFKNNKKADEFIYFNLLPMYKHEVDTSRYPDGTKKFNILVQSNGYINATFVDENNKRYNIGVSCYDNKYIYYVTSDNSVSQSAIKTKIDALKQFMLIVKPSTPVSQTLNTTSSPTHTTTTTTPATTHGSTNCTSTQCSGTTQKGGRCKRMTTSCSGRCYQH